MIRKNVAEILENNLTLVPVHAVLRFYGRLARLKSIRVCTRPVRVCYSQFRYRKSYNGIFNSGSNILQVLSGS